MHPAPYDYTLPDILYIEQMNYFAEGHPDTNIPTYPEELRKQLLERTLSRIEECLEGGKHVFVTDNKGIALPKGAKHIWDYLDLDSQINAGSLPTQPILEFGGAHLGCYFPTPYSANHPEILPDNLHKRMTRDLEDGENPFLVRGCITNALIGASVHVFNDPKSHLYQKRHTQLYFINSEICKGKLLITEKQTCQDDGLPLPTRDQLFTLPFKRLLIQSTNGQLCLGISADRADQTR